MPTNAHPNDQATSDARISCREEAAHLARHAESGDIAEEESAHRTFHTCIRHLAEVTGLHIDTLTDEMLAPATHADRLAALRTELAR